MSADSYRAFYTRNRDVVLRTQAVRRRAKRLGLRLVALRDRLSMYDTGGQLVASGSVEDMEHSVGHRSARAGPVRNRP